MVLLQSACISPAALEDPPKFGWFSINVPPQEIDCTTCNVKFAYLPCFRNNDGMFDFLYRFWFPFSLHVFGEFKIASDQVNRLCQYLKSKKKSFFLSNDEAILTHIWKIIGWGDLKEVLLLRKPLQGKKWSPSTIVHTNVFFDEQVCWEHNHVRECHSRMIGRFLPEKEQ